MRNRLLNSAFSLIVVISIILVAGCTTSPATAPPPTPAQTPLPAISFPSPPPQLEVKSVKLTDPTNDLFDKAGNPIKDEPYMDIVEAEVTDLGSNYLVRIELKGPLPAKTPDSSLFFEWDIYVDADNNPTTGATWPLVVNDLGFEYMTRLMLLDSQYRAQVYDINTKKTENIEYKISGNAIELRWPKQANQSDTFNFVITAKKYGERGSGSAFMLADKAPNYGHCNFPAGCSTSEVKPVDTDNDGFTDDEEISILNTDPKTPEKWDDLDTVTNILNTPEKINLYLKRKFTEKRLPSQLFAESINDLFKRKSGDCDEYARLPLYWLSKNGYEAYLADIYFNQWWQEYNQWLEHDICVYKGKDGLWYSFDIYNFGNNPKGPFKSVDEIISQLPSHYGATDWNKYILYNTLGGFISQKTK